MPIAIIVSPSWEEMQMAIKVSLWEEMQTAIKVSLSWEEVLIAIKVLPCLGRSADSHKSITLTGNKGR